VSYYGLPHGMDADMEGTVREEGLRRRCAIALPCASDDRFAASSFQTMSDCHVLLSATNLPALPPNDAATVPSRSHLIYS